MAKNKPKATTRDLSFFELLVSSYPDGIISESMDKVTKRLEAYQYKRATIHRTIRKLCYCGLLVECGKVGKTGKIIIYQIRK